MPGLVPSFRPAFVICHFHGNLFNKYSEILKLLKVAACWNKKDPPPPDKTKSSFLVKFKLRCVNMHAHYKPHPS